MARFGQFGWSTGALACLAALGVPSLADAAWLGYKNDTNVPVIIQCAIVVNNQPRWGKPHSLFPGEVAWDAVTAPGPRLLGVFDPKQNNRLVYTEPITVGVADIFLSLQMVTPPPVRGQPPQPAQPRFIPTKPPVTPPGGLTPAPRGPQMPPGTPPNPNPKPPATPPNNPAPKSPTTPPATPPGKSGGG